MRQWIETQVSALVIREATAGDAAAIRRDLRAPMCCTARRPSTPSRPMPRSWRDKIADMAARGWPFVVADEGNGGDRPMPMPRNFRDPSGLS